MNFFHRRRKQRKAQIAPTARATSEERQKQGELSADVQIRESWSTIFGMDYGEFSTLTRKQKAKIYDKIIEA